MTRTSGIMAHRPRKRRLTAKQKATSLYQLWHGLQDMKQEAAGMNDKELGLLIGMIELLVEERTAPTITNR